MRAPLLPFAVLMASCSLSGPTDLRDGTSLADATFGRAGGPAEPVDRVDRDDGEREQERERRAGPAREGFAEEEGEEETDEPDRALEWRRLRWRDENGVFDPARVAVAHQQRDANALYHQVIDDAGIGRFGWVERGPFNIGGRTRSLVINPADGNELWAGSVGGGIWHSTDGGTTWAPINDFLGNLAVCSLAIVAGTPPTIYAGTGEGFFNGDGLVGAGIFKSVDGGVTFTKLGATASWSYVNRIAVHPTSSSILLAATRGNGIQRSADGGATWAQVRAIANCLQVLFDPNDGSRCVADCYDNTNHFVVLSTDAGATWTNATTGLINQPGISGRIELCYAKSVNNMVYASCGSGGGKIWRSTDGGANWVQRTTGTGSGAAWYYNSLWVDPTDSNFLVTGAYQIYKSTNGGTSLVQIADGYINTTVPHPDNHGFIADPAFSLVNRKVWAVNDGGVYVAPDIRAATTTSGWQRKEQTYRVSQFYGAAGDGASGRLNGGTQDNGSLTLQSGATAAQLTFGGDGGFAAIDWVNPNFIYGEYVTAQVHRSTNGGASAGYIWSGIADAGSNANFIAPFILDPNDPARLLVGGASLWRTSNARAGTVAWASIKPAAAARISAIAVAPGNANVIWVGHNDGAIYRTTNGLAAVPTWVAVDDNGATNPLPNRYVARILIDNTSSTTAFVALGGFAGDNLWKTTNSGGSFADLTGTGATGLPSAPINGITQHPTLADRLYVGTEVGVFASQDGGAHWSTRNDGPGDVSVEEVVFVHGTTQLLVATHGRGLWTIDIAEASVAQLGPGCPGTLGLPNLTAAAPRLGSLLTPICSNVPGGTLVLMLIGFSATDWNGVPLPLPLDAIGLNGCLLRTTPDIVDAGFALGNSRLMFLNIPPQPAFLGATFHMQALVSDPPANPGGGVLSNALSLTIGN